MNTFGNRSETSQDNDTFWKDTEVPTHQRNTRIIKAATALGLASFLFVAGKTTAHIFEKPAPWGVPVKSVEPQPPVSLSVTVVPSTISVDRLNPCTNPDLALTPSPSITESDDAVALYKQEVVDQSGRDMCLGKTK